MNVKFLLKLCKSTTETHSLLKQVLQGWMSIAHPVFWVVLAVERERDEVKDDPCSGQPSMSITQEKIWIIQQCDL